MRLTSALVFLISVPLSGQVTPVDTDSRRVHDALIQSLASNNVWANGIIRIEVDQHQVAANGMVQDEKTAQKVAAILQAFAGGRTTKQELKIRPLLPPYDQLAASPVAQTNPRLRSYCDVRGVTEALVPPRAQEHMTRLRIQKFVHDLFGKSLSVRFTTENMSIAAASENTRRPDHTAHPAIRAAARKITRESEEILEGFRILFPEFGNSTPVVKDDMPASTRELLHRLTLLSRELYTYIHSYFYPQKTQSGTIASSDLLNPRAAALLKEIQRIARKVGQLS